MRVATFNVHHCEGRDGVLDVRRVADVVRATEADVVALQELDMGMERTGFTNQPGEIAAATGLTVEFHPVLEFGDGRYGNALAAKARLDSQKVPLPSVAREEPRAAVVGRYQGISFVGTHLSRSRRARAEQIRALAALAERLDPPVVLMGDLNERFGGLTPLLAAGFTAVRLPFWRRLWLWLRPSRAIDHILAGPGLRIELLQTIKTNASDHPVLVAEVHPAE
ncbi:MAG TPA: endonuclease/exonuclease/phosphatase family protein [Actinomycetota bacterium]|nr:endonuclease/exonuclease/phosphatase family protein [Actinomycetota bacterium]